MANELPEGFTLDQPAQPQGLPEGFTLDQPQQSSQFDPLKDISVFGVTGQDVAGAANLGLNIATGIPARSVAGIQAIPDIIQGDAEAGLETVRRVEEQIQTPLSESGQGVAAKIGEFITDLGDNPGFAGIVDQLKNAQQGLTETLGQTLSFAADPVSTVQNIQTGDPLSERAEIARGVGESVAVAAPLTAAEVLPFVKPAAGIAAVSKFNPANLVSKFGKNLAKKQEFTGKLVEQLSARQKQNLIAAEIKAGNTNIENVTKFVTDSGRIQTSKASNKALKSKFLGNENQTAKTVSIFERADTATKEGINKMLDDIVKGRNDPKFLGRSSDTVGDSIVKRVQEASKLNTSAGEQIGAVAKSLKGQQVNIGAARKQFFDELEKLGVTFKTGEDGFVTPDFSRSKFIGGSQKDMNVLVNDLLNDSVGFEFAHELKRTIREGLNIDKGGATGIGKGRSQKIMTDLASGIDKVLDNTSKAYDNANIKFAKTVEIVEKFQKLAGKDVDLFSDTAALTLANKAKRITSNAGTGPIIRRDIAKIDEILKDLGVTIEDDVQSLLIASDDLERIFDLAKANSLKGNILDAGRKLARGDIPAEEIAGFVKKAFSPSETKVFNQKIKVLRDLVKPKGEAPNVKKNTSSPVKPENKLTEILKAEKPRDLSTTKDFLLGKVKVKRELRSVKKQTLPKGTEGADQFKAIKKIDSKAKVTGHNKDGSVNVEFIDQYKPKQVNKDNDFLFEFDPKALEITEGKFKNIDNFKGDPNKTISVTKIDGDYFVLDGHHRTKLAQRDGRKIKAVVIPEEAYLKMKKDGIHPADMMKEFALTKPLRKGKK